MLAGINSIQFKPSMDIGPFSSRRDAGMVKPANLLELAKNE
jgi:hypothetical protein